MAHTPELTPLQLVSCIGMAVTTLSQQGRLRLTLRICYTAALHGASHVAVEHNACGSKRAFSCFSLTTTGIDCCNRQARKQQQENASTRAQLAARSAVCMHHGMLEAWHCMLTRHSLLAPDQHNICMPKHARLTLGVSICSCGNDDSSRGYIGHVREGFNSNRSRWRNSKDGQRCSS